RRSLRLPAEGTALTHSLDEPLATGRLDLAFFDDGAVVAGRQCVLEPAFRGPADRSVMRVILGWSEESLAVESPSGPALAVQRLARTPAGTGSPSASDPTRPRSPSTARSWPTARDPKGR